SLFLAPRSRPLRPPDARTRAVPSSVVPSDNASAVADVSARHGFAGVVARDLGGWCMGSDVDNMMTFVREQGDQQICSTCLAFELKLRFEVVVSAADAGEEKAELRV